MAHSPSLAQGRDVGQQRIDARFLSGRHLWELEPLSGLSFRDTVEQNTMRRVDMAQYKLISAVNSQKAKDLFSGLANSPTLFRIPHSLPCDRTFVRDREEAIYLDAMDTYLSQEDTTMTISDIPLLKRPLQNRLFCAFARKPGYLSELFERRRLKMWIPSDAPENKELSDPVLGGLYPKIEAWLNLVCQPTCLPVPLPFVVFYFHKELRDAQLDPELGSSERVRRLLVCLQMEYYLLFLATWWNEAFHGGRMFVLDESTIRVLEQYCSGIPDIAGKPGQVIIEHMRMASQLPNRWHNWMCHRDRSMESSVFIWSRRGYGGLDPSAQTGVRIFCDRISRKITSTRYGSSLFKRCSAMDQRLSAPDLDDIEGLLGLVRDHEWDVHGSLRVSDSLHHMLSLYRKTHQGSSVVARENDDLRRELDYLKEDLRGRDEKIWDREKRLDHALNRVDSHERYIDELLANVSNLELQVAELRKAREDALRSANEPHKSRRETPRRIFDPFAEDHDDTSGPRSFPGTPRSRDYLPGSIYPQASPANPIAAGSASTRVMRSRSQHSLNAVYWGIPKAKGNATEKAKGNAQLTTGWNVGGSTRLTRSRPQHSLNAVYWGILQKPKGNASEKAKDNAAEKAKGSAQLTAGWTMGTSSQQHVTERQYTFHKRLPSGEQSGDTRRHFRINTGSIGNANNSPFIQPAQAQNSQLKGSSSRDIDDRAAKRPCSRGVSK